MIFTLNNALIHQSQYQDCILCSYVLPHVPCKIKVYFFPILQWTDERCKEIVYT